MFDHNEMRKPEHQEKVTETNTTNINVTICMTVVLII